MRVTRNLVLATVASASLLLLHPRASAGMPLPGDADAVLRARSVLLDTLAWLDAHPDVLSPGRAATHVPELELRDAARDAWSRMLDATVTLDVIAQARSGWWTASGADRGRFLAVLRAAHAAKYRAALELIDRVEQDLAVRAILDEPMPEMGLPGGSYSRLKADVLDVDEALSWLAARVAARAVRCRSCDALEDAADEDSEVIERFGRWRGESLTVVDALARARGLGERAWFPVQTSLAEWMGDTKVRRVGECVLTQGHARALATRLEPGDILLTRREWYLSNVGLPGWWSHAALYLGTPEERRAWSDEPSLRSWLDAHDVHDLHDGDGGDLDALMRRAAPRAGARARGAAGDGHPVRVLEAISEGVSFTSIEHAAGCDAIAVLRPRLPRAARAAAIVRALRYAGRPYDYDFDFRTDAALVCTELVCKAYEATGEPRLAFPVTTLLGRPLMAANDMARLFDEEADSPGRQFDLVAFLDGDERTGRVLEPGEAEFRRTWRRPKWHVIEQSLRTAAPQP